MLTSWLYESPSQSISIGSAEKIVCSHTAWGLVLMQLDLMLTGLQYVLS